MPSFGLRRDPYRSIQLPSWTQLLEQHRGQAVSGIPISSRLHPPVSFVAPYDLARQGRFPLEFCPGYWPEHQPEKTANEFCSGDYYTYWPLFQGTDENPFRIAREQVRQINANEAEARRRATWAALNWYVNGADEHAAATAITVALSSEERIRDDTLFEIELQQILEILPESIWRVVPDEASSAVDLRVTSSLSYDSAVSMGKTLQLAAERGIDAIVVADSGHIAGAQKARAIADTLKDRGELPVDFHVIVGEHITCAGGVNLTAVGIESRIIEGMTLARTIREIREQGGVVIMNHPGELGGPALVRRLDVDGYFIQPRLFELFRTLSILHDPDLADKPALYASNARYSQLVGLPYSAVLGQDSDQDSLLEALKNRQVYAAGNLYLPLMAFILIDPISRYEKTLNRYFKCHDWLTEHSRKLLHADNLILQTSWDRSIINLMSLDAPGWDEVDMLHDGSSPFFDGPRIVSIAAQWGDVQVMYRRSDDSVWMTSRLEF
ncbi:MAG: hypothetical protein R6V19_03095 [Armatimonadota bacterium]